jgi:DNA invertase Pin-like site-specific DNA recombinase
LKQCLKALRSGDTLIVWRLDRLGRSLVDLIKIVSGLEADGIRFVSVSKLIATDTASGKLIFHVKAGLMAARARGRSGGRKPALDDKQITEVKALMKDKSIEVSTIAKRYGISRATAYNIQHWINT